MKLDDGEIAANQMMELNKVGAALGKISGVHAMTDVTGFGLLGHLIEMAEGSGLSAEIVFEHIPLISERLISYVEAGAVPGGTNRNWDSYGNKVVIGAAQNGSLVKNILADPQTSGGLLVAVDPQHVDAVVGELKAFGLEDRIRPIGRITSKASSVITVH